MKKLIIAEKPSVARDISIVLGKFQNKDGYVENESYIVSWAIGHLVELAQPEDYSEDLKKWDLKTLPIIPESFKLKAISSTAKQFKVLKNLLNSPEVDLVINACDAGREGELIFRRIYQLVGCKKPTKRLWLSETTPSAVEKAFSNLRDSKELDNLAVAGEARSKADWLVGLNASRAFSVKHNSVLSLGRVQTPTLALIVNRDLDIRNFKPQPYWEVLTTFSNSSGQTYTGKWIKDNNSKIINNSEAENIKSNIGQNGTILSVEQKEVEEKPPQLFNLNDLQKEANRRYGMTAQQTLNIAQALYEKHKLLTYPRTDSRYLTEAIATDTIKERLEAISTIETYNLLIPSSYSDLGKRYIDNSKVSDHHAIIPTAFTTNFKNLSKDELLIYDLVVRRFLSMLYSPAKYAETVVITNAFGDFISKGKVELMAGWKVLKVQEDTADPEEQLSLPKLTENEKVMVDSKNIVDKQTQPPKRFTEDTLLGAMENAGRFVDDKEAVEILKETKGVGTSATRAAIIETLIKRQYVERQKKYLVPTIKGETLINLTPEPLKSVGLTATWESGLSDIEKGKGSIEWLEGIKSFTKEIVDLAKTQECSQNLNTQETEVLGQCPKCGKDIKEYSKSYSCSGYKDSGCSFVIWKVIAGKKIAKKVAKDLLKNKKSAVIKGFTSKSKKKFDASLIINNGKIEFKFPERVIS